MTIHPLPSRIAEPQARQLQAQAEPVDKQKKMERTVYKLIELMSQLQLHLLDLSREFNIQKAEATREMMQAYKEAARGFYKQAACTGVGLIGGGFSGSFGMASLLQSSQNFASFFSSFGQIGSDIAKKFPEGRVRDAEGRQRKFEQLSQELGQSFQSTATAIDSLGEKLQAAMRNAAPAA